MKRSTKVGGAAAAVIATGGLLTLGSVFPANAAPLPAGCTATGTTVTCQYYYTGGQQTFVAPAGITSYNVIAAGAAGGNGPGGATLGGFGAGVVDTVSLNPGQTYYINVGGVGGSSTGQVNAPGQPGGYNGGGNGSAALTNGFIDSAGGGGATSLQVASGQCNLTGALVVAAGGGGASAGGGGSAAHNGFDGGAGPVPGTTGGKGATTSAGGAAGNNGAYTGNPQPGTACHGGNGGPATPGTGGNVGGAGGGGGLFGGGGGGAVSGGGGGSSFGSASATFTSVNTAAGLRITYVDPSLATPIVDPTMGLAAVAGIGAAALVVVGRRRRTVVTTQS